MKKYISLIIVFVLLFTLGGCRYKGYYETKIPTDSTLRGTIKIPNEWEFITEDGVIQLIDKETKEVIAEQIVQGHFELISNIYGKDEIVFIDSNDLVLAIYRTYDKDNTKLKPYIMIGGLK